MHMTSYHKICAIVVTTEQRNQTSHIYAGESKQSSSAIIVDI